MHICSDLPSRLLITYIYFPDIFWIPNDISHLSNPHITTYAQGKDPTLSPPHWRKPGRGTLDNHLSYLMQEILVLEGFQNFGGYSWLVSVFPKYNFRSANADIRAWKSILYPNLPHPSIIMRKSLLWINSDMGFASYLKGVISKDRGYK